MPGNKAHVDDEIDELPPLDGADGDDDKIDVGEHTLDASIEDDNPFDDEEAGDTGAGVDSFDDGEDLLSTDEADDLDIGELDEIREEKIALSDYEPSGRLDLAEGDFKEEVSEKDDGEEGPLRDDDSLVDGALPAMDEDDNSEVDDAALFDPSLLREAAREIAWDDKTWERRSEGGIEPPEDEPDAPFVTHPPSDGRIVSSASRGGRTVVAVEDEGAYFSVDDAQWQFVPGTERCSAVGFVGDLMILALQNAGSGGALCALRERGLTKLAELHDDEAPVIHLMWDGRSVYARAASKTIVFDVK